MLNHKKIAFGIMGLLTIAMITFTAIDFLKKPTYSNAKPHQPSSNMTTVILTVKPQALQKKSEKPKSENPLSIKPKKKSGTLKPPIAVSLSKDTQMILDALVDEYKSTVNTRKIKAQIKETQARKEYLALTAKTKAKPKKKSSRLPILNNILPERITIKSIIFNNKHITAWVKIDDQLVPLKQGSKLESATVLNITKNTVVFDNHGKIFTRYISNN